MNNVLSKIFNRDLLARIMIFLAGVFLISLGIFLFINSQLGSDPVTVLIDGISETLGLTVGQANFLINGGIILALLLLTGRKFGPGTILHAVFVGIFVDVLFYIFGDATPQFILYRFMMLTAAPISLGSGIAIYVSAGMGEGALEALMMLLKEKSNFSLKIIKTAMDITFGAAGVLLGATFGIGTLFGALAIGPVTQLAFGYVRRIKAYAGYRQNS